MTLREALGTLRRLEHQYAAFQELDRVLAAAVTIEEDLERLGRQRAELEAQVVAVEKHCATRKAAAQQARDQADAEIARSREQKESEVARAAEAAQRQIQEWKARVVTAREAYQTAAADFTVRLDGLKRDEQAMLVTVGRLNKERAEIRSRLDALKVAVE